MSAPKWEAPSELYFYDEWLQQNAKGRMLCGNNRYVRDDICTPTYERVKALVEAAFCEGFAEGSDGCWIEGDYTPAWKGSETYAALSPIRNDD